MKFPFLLLFLTLAGCAPHPRVIVPGTRYRIVELEDNALMLAPPVAGMPVDKPLELRFPVALGPAAVRRNSGSLCAEQTDLFSVRIDLATRQLALAMPSLAGWQRKLPEFDQPDRNELELKIESMLEAPQALESRGCLSPGSAIALRQLLRDAIPMRPGFDLYPAYGYRPSGLGLDLKAGVRLKIQRAHFNGPEPADGKRALKDLLGVTTVYYAAKMDTRHQGVAFAPPTILYDSAKLKAAVSRSWEDLRFARQARPRPVYRLFLLTSFPQKGLRRTALVLGAPSISAMDAMQRKILADPAVACDELTRGSTATCVSFDGDVSVSAEVSVKVNGVSTYLDWGSNVQSVLRKFHADQAAVIRLRRLFGGKPMPVEAGPKLAGMLEKTVLIAGDELSWDEPDSGAIH